MNNTTKASLALAAVMAAGIVSAPGAQAAPKAPTGQTWEQGGMTPQYWAQNCMRERLGLKGQALQDWRQWCVRIQPKRAR